MGVAESPEAMSGEPTLGGTLNATSGQAAEDARKELENDQNKTILSHAYLSESPANTAPMNGQAEVTEASAADIFAAPSGELEAPSAPVASTMGEMTITPPTSAYAVEETRDDASRDDALAAVHATFDETPAAQPAAPAMFSPTPGIILPPPPPLPDFSQLPPAPAVTSAYAPEETLPPTERLGDIFPDPQAPPPAPASDDPGQFKIPGQ